ncbi:MAG: O-antigen ligase domain-containing protein, partial [Afipia sp.]|nr:O-antigen ligase domain-containing protein [Afipia sp.]
MASFAAADYALPAAATPPGIAAIQRLLMWAVGASGAIVFIEPSPYELVTLASVIFFFATGLRMRPVFISLLILLFLLNIGYTICSVYLMDKPEIVNWILTSWYMAITSLFFAMVLSEDTASRLEFLRRGLIFGA